MVLDLNLLSSTHFESNLFILDSIDINDRKESGAKRLALTVRLKYRYRVIGTWVFGSETLPGTYRVIARLNWTTTSILLSWRLSPTRAGDLYFVCVQMFEIYVSSVMIAKLSLLQEVYEHYARYALVRHVGKRMLLECTTSLKSTWVKHDLP